MPQAALAPLFDLAPVVLEDPINLGSAPAPAPLRWGTAAYNFKEGHPAHFFIQIALSAAFTVIAEQARSAVSTAGFEYENTLGVWLPLPSSGLAEADFGKDVRYTSSLVTLQDYWWRVRVEQIY